MIHELLLMMEHAWNLLLAWGLSPGAGVPIVITQAPGWPSSVFGDVGTTTEDNLDATSGMRALPCRAVTFCSREFEV
jgi:hypothetical protein